MRLKIKNLSPLPFRLIRNQGPLLLQQQIFENYIYKLHQRNTWPVNGLVLNAKNADYIESLNCSVCKNYADKLKGMKNFSIVWAFTGSTNLRLSNAEDHALGEPHQKVLDLHQKCTKEQSASERAESMKSSNNAGKQSIISGIKSTQSADFEKTKKNSRLRIS